MPATNRGDGSSRGPREPRRGAVRGVWDRQVNRSRGGFAPAVSGTAGRRAERGRGARAVPEAPVSGPRPREARADHRLADPAAAQFPRRAGPGAATGA